MDPQPVSDKIPTEDGGYQIYKAANKLQGKKALITGGDSGIGRAIAILFAMEGAESMIVYLPEEEKDAHDTQRSVQERGGKLHLLPMDITSAANCKKIVEAALEKMGTINVLVNNAGYQMMQQSIQDISEYVVHPDLGSQNMTDELFLYPTENNGKRPSSQISIPSSGYPNIPSHTCPKETPSSTAAR